MSKNTGKTKIFLKFLFVILFGGAVVAAADLLVSLKKERDAMAHEANAASAKSLWTAVDVDGLVEIGYRGVPLELQVSEGTTVFISYSPDDAPPIAMSADNPDLCWENYKANTYDFSEVFSRIMLFKVERERAGADMSVLLTGDHNAKCVSFIRVLEEIKRAEIPRIFFETNFRPSAMAVRYEHAPDFICGCGVPGLIYTEWVKKTPQDVTITITRENTILWGKKPVTLDEFVTKAHDFTIKHGSEKIQLTVLFDNDADYAALRYVLDQWRRTGIWRVMVASQKSA